MERVGIVIFAYNRSWHLQQSLNGLQKNNEVDKLYVFQDGLKCEEHREGWEKTKKVIEEIDWCNVNYVLSSVNKGLAKSIVDGINYVLEENDAVIVLEDDCVPAPNFINFMKQCFEKYKDEKKVYSVSGYSWPIELPKSDSDAYFCGRISSWGWGTWKDRWKQYHVDNLAIKKMKENKEMSKSLAMWGKDLEQMLLSNICGESDSWALYWALTVIENGGVCINPYCSLIQNIGMDGTGRHCGNENRFDVSLDADDNLKNFKLPDEVKILPTTQMAFAELYGSYSAVGFEGTKEKVIVYGLGNFYFVNEKAINQKFKVSAFIDRSKNGWFAGKKVITPAEVSSIQFDKIVIVIQSIQQCINVSKKLITECGVDYRKIELAHNLFGKYKNCFQSISVLQDGNILVSSKGINVKVCSEDEFNNVYEVLIDENYHYFLNNQKKDIVLDVGMNIGDSALYFLNNHKVEKVYAFEPFLKTYLAAQDNLKNYILNSDKIEIFQYGISNENEKRNIGFNEDMTCGQSTISDVREFAHKIYQEYGLIKKENEVNEQIEVRKASEVFAPIIQKHVHNNIILKMDCEGEEYSILEELSQTGLLCKFDFIMLEWHYQGKKILLNCLKKAGFSYWCNDKSEKMGLIYGYK